MFENIDFNALIEKATKEKCEITKIGRASCRERV